MENRRRDNPWPGAAIIFVLFSMFASILFSLVREQLKPEVLTLVGGYGSSVLQLVSLIVGYYWGSSKGSHDKDNLVAAANAAPRVLVPGMTPVQPATDTPASDTMKGS